MDTTEYRYQGYAYRQTPSGEMLVSLVAPAEEIQEWAGIPRRSEENLTGFQRAEDEKRVDKAKRFFEIPENQSPTALIIGVHPDFDGPYAPPQLVLGEEIRPGIHQCELVIAAPPKDLSAAEAAEIVKSQVQRRLADEPIAEDADEEVDVEGEGEESDAEDAEAADANGSTDSEVRIGTSVIRLLAERLDDEEWVAQDEVLEALRDMAKPATCIDGQHRLLGAAAVERNIPFSVCAIMDCPWQEQVFQFTVVNTTAKSIPGQFITANAALSLTKSELAELQPRLVQAGIKVIEFELMAVVNFDEESPFYELINLTEGADASKIGYQTMVRVAKKWYEGTNPAIEPLLRNLYPEIKGRRAVAARRERWKQEDWGLFFKDFWDEVKSRYSQVASHEEGHTLWDVGHSNLMIAAVLESLQDSFFRNLGAQDEEFFEVDGDEPIDELRKKFRNRAERFLDYVPEEFFATEWGMKSLNTGAGRAILEQTMRDLIDSRGKSNYKRSELITGAGGS